MENSSGRYLAAPVSSADPGTESLPPARAPRLPAELFLAFSFEAPRQLVIWSTTNAPASSRPSQAGMRSGGLRPRPRPGEAAATPRPAPGRCPRRCRRQDRRVDRSERRGRASVISMNDQIPVRPRRSPAPAASAPCPPGDPRRPARRSRRSAAGSPVPRAARSCPHARSPPASALTTGRAAVRRADHPRSSPAAGSLVHGDVALRDDPAGARPRRGRQQVVGAPGPQLTVAANTWSTLRRLRKSASAVIWCTITSGPAASTAAITASRSSPSTTTGFDHLRSRATLPGVLVAVTSTRRDQPRNEVPSQCPRSLPRRRLA